MRLFPLNFSLCRTSTLTHNRVNNSATNLTQWNNRLPTVLCHLSLLSSSWIIALLVLYIDLRPGQTCHSKDGRSCIFRWRGRAWLTIWDRIKIPRYSHELMHRKRVTCELPDSYFRSMMIKTCHSKDGGSCIFRWPFMGRDWVDVELLLNSVHRKFNQLGSRWVGDKMRERKPAPREAGPPGPGWAAQENGKETLMAIRVGVNMWQFCLVSNFLSHTTLSIKWEVCFSKELFRSSLLCRCVMHTDVYVLCGYTILLGFTICWLRQKSKTPNKKKVSWVWL